MPSTHEAEEGIAILVITPGGTGQAPREFIQSILQEINQKPDFRVGKASDPRIRDLQFATIDLSFLSKKCRVKHGFIFLFDIQCRNTAERDSLSKRVREWRQTPSPKIILGGLIYLDDASGDAGASNTLEFCKLVCEEDRLPEIIVVQSIPTPSTHTEKGDSTFYDLLQSLEIGDIDAIAMPEGGIRASPLGGVRSAWGAVSLLLLPYVDLGEILDKKDAYVIVLGLTGAGKSTFINAATGEVNMKVGYGLTSCTKKIEVAEIKSSGHQGQRVFMVDTPGLNDSALEDRETLKLITDWINSGKEAKNVVGIIYIHDISQDRVTKGDTVRFRELQNIYGEDFFQRVVFGMTKANRLSAEVLQFREKELREKHWTSMVAKGARICRFDNDAASAWRILELALTHHAERRMLQVQKEMTMGHFLQHANPRSALDRENAVYIIVMGPTGVGKSSFINSVLGKEEMKVGESLASCTKKIADAEVTNIGTRSRRVFIVDTPGFDDGSGEPSLQDTKLLESIALWSIAGRLGPKNIAGVIYLHDISADRLINSTQITLQAIQKICGEGSFDKVVIGTTKPGNMASSDLQKRIDELKTGEWRYMIEKGTRICQCYPDDSGASSRKIVRTILDNHGHEEGDSLLRLQKEILQEKKSIAKTEAYRILSIRYRASERRGISYFLRHLLFGL